MKKEVLQEQFRQIAIDKDTAPNTGRETFHQTLLTKLFIEMLNDFNEITSKYNIRLMRLTVAIALLTLVMVLKMFIG